MALDETGCNACGSALPLLSVHVDGFALLQQIIASSDLGLLRAALDRLNVPESYFDTPTHPSELMQKR